MSRSTKRDLHGALNRDSGRVPVIRKERDCRVSHSHACTMCERGTSVKRLMRIKPRRRLEERDLSRIVAETAENES